MSDIIIYLIKNLIKYINKFKLKIIINSILLALLFAGSKNRSLIFEELKNIKILNIILKDPFLSVYIFFVLAITILKISEVPKHIKKIRETESFFLETSEKKNEPITNAINLILNLMILAMLFIILASQVNLANSFIVGFFAVGYLIMLITLFYISNQLD